MSSATDDGKRPEESKDQPVTPPAEGWVDQATPEPAPAPEPAPTSGQLDSTPWIEPQVASRQILTELFRSGGKTLEELEGILTTHQTGIGWAAYWAQAGFLTESQVNGAQRFQLSRRAVLELELD